jgi:hypothetical protein
MFRRNRGWVVFGLGLALQLGEGLPVVGIDHNHKVPALEVAAGRRLEGEIKALLGQLPFDWAGQVQPPTAPSWAAPGGRWREWPPPERFVS